MTIITRRGNAFNEDRQSYWYLSATTDKCLVWLEGVTKPVLEQNNYYMILGRLPNLDLFDNLPVNYKHSYIFARAGIFGELYRVDWQGLPVQELVDRGFGRPKSRPLTILTPIRRSGRTRFGTTAANGSA